MISPSLVLDILGLEDTIFGPNNPQDGALDDNTARFAFVDGSPEGLDFFARANEFPWGNGEPNDQGQADCVR